MCKEISDEELVKLFYGMSDTMKHAVLEIMKTVQTKKDAYADYRHRIVAAAFEIESELKGE